jgi:thiol-disulfide isomerase/thioredoxin
LVIVTLLFFAGCGGPHANMHGNLLAPGSELPAIEAEGWLNGPGPTAEELRDHVGVIDVWAYWCGPCRAAMPEMVAAYDKYKDRGVHFLGLTMERGDKLEETQQVVTNSQLAYPNAYGAGETIKALGVEAIPSVFVIGKDGRIMWHSDRPGTMEDAIESALERS